jgi:ubiquinone/menaquinone biosynthesis C-methylase UbiE
VGDIRTSSQASRQHPVSPRDIGLPGFRCPVCKGPLDEHQEPPAYSCTACKQTYPIISGIADFRVWPDPYIGRADDWAKGLRVWREANGRFAAMLETYWRLTPDVPATMAARFIRYALVGAARGHSRCKRVGRVRGRVLGQTDILLDIGCGSGGLVVAASKQVRAVVGVDIAARWLVVARAQLEESGVRNALLVCACAEHLPFADGTFTVAVANDVLEHCQDQPQFLRELRRTLMQHGLLLLSTQNRWSLRGEPHVRLWGVGLLPRRWMARYVRWIRRVPYRLIRLVSYPELHLLLREAGFRSFRHLSPEVAPEELAGLASRERWLVTVYRALSQVPGLQAVLFLVGPVLEVVAQPHPP